MYFENDEYLSRGEFCQTYLDDGMPECCSSGVNRTQYLLWIYRTCNAAKIGPVLPTTWRNELMLVDPTSEVTASVIPELPSCMKDNACHTDLDTMRQNLTMQKCVVVNDNCTDTPMVINITTFCSDIAYETTCSSACRLSWERAELLRFMNESCFMAKGWQGLPSNWTLLLQIQDNELSPWAPIIQWDSSSANGNSSKPTESKAKCPSNAAKLGVFAAVNVVSSLLLNPYGRG
jgi:hypothetical protein